MRFQVRQQNTVRPYHRISLGKRKRLIEMVENQGLTILRASKKLKIKITTARLIVKKYNETGRFTTRNFKSKVSQNGKEEVYAQVHMEEANRPETVKQEAISQEPERQREDQSLTGLMVPFPVSQPNYYPLFWNYTGFLWQL